LKSQGSSIKKLTFEKLKKERLVIPKKA